jgi:hypothetical protein
VVRRGGGFTGFTGYVGTEEIDGAATRDWLTALGSRHAGASLADYALALGQELTAVWQDLGLKSVLEFLVSGVENGDVRFWFVRNSDGLYDKDWTYKPPKRDFDVVDDLDGRYVPRDLRPGRPRRNSSTSRCTRSGRACCSRPRTSSTRSAGSWGCSTSRASRDSSQSHHWTT